MNWLLYAGAGLLLLVAALAVWRSFTSPEWLTRFFVSAGVGLLRLISGALAAQAAKDMLDPEVDQKNKEAAHKPAGPIPEGTGVTTGKVITQPAATKRNRPKP